MQKPHSILFVEPDKERRFHLELFLKKVGYQVIAVADTESGMKFVLEDCPKLLILSVTSASTTVFNFCHALKKNLVGGDVTVVFIGSTADPRAKSEAAKVRGDFWAPEILNTNDLGADLYYLLNSDLSNGDPSFRVIERLTAPQNRAGQAEVSFSQPGIGEPILDGRPQVQDIPRTQSAQSMRLRDPRETPATGPDPAIHEVNQLLQSITGSLYQTNQTLNSLIQYIEGLGRK